MRTIPLLLGYDIGSSSVKASIIESHSGKLIASAQSPVEELPINSRHSGWAEQDPETWMKHLTLATRKLAAKADLKNVESIGISYQMHGLVIIDKKGRVLRPAIIWCDSRAVEIGKKAFIDLGQQYCLEHLLNSPGNLTASKLRWVKENEPGLFKKIDKVLLPGDYIAYKLTGLPTTTVSGLSEGILWDYVENKVANRLLDYYEIKANLIPEIVPVFTSQLKLNKAWADALGLRSGMEVSYRAGDQLNNAFSLNVMKPGEAAVTAGTSGVVYAVSKSAKYDRQSRINTFAHVNHSSKSPNHGLLLCVNGCGSANSWLRNHIGNKQFSYDQLNKMAAKTNIGADGLSLLPFGNGAERMLENRITSAHFAGLDFNRHNIGHLSRAVQEGIAYSLNYGLQVFKDMDVKITRFKAGNANMFLSPLFREIFTNVTGKPLELYNTDGSIGAARGGGLGAGILSEDQSFNNLKKVRTYEPTSTLQKAYQSKYLNWQEILKRTIEK